MITIVTFGYGHGEPPPSDYELDLRPYRDPHIDPEFRNLTAHNQLVVDKVAETPGVAAEIRKAAAAASWLATDGRDVTVASGCIGGRHRGPAGGMLLATELEAAGHHVRLIHRDIDKPVINR